MDNRKKYLIELYFKKCSIPSISKKQLDFVFDTRQNHFKLEEEKLKEIKEKYTVEYFFSNIADVIDRTFSENELAEIIKFYSSPVGIKMLNPQFIEEISLFSAIGISRRFSAFLFLTSSREDENASCFAFISNLGFS